MDSYIMNMGFNNEVVISKPNSLHNSILYSKSMKVFLFCGNLFYSTLLLSGLITGLLYGYSMIEDSMSLLGSSRTAPVPLLFNFSCIFAGFILVPLFLILEKQIVSEQYPKANKILNKFGLVVGIMAAIGVFFVGVFSMDFSQFLHNIATGFTFGGLIATAAFFGVSLSLHNSKRSKIFGYFGALIPGMMLFGWGFFKNAIFEWLMLFSVLLFLIPMAFRVVFLQER